MGHSTSLRELLRALNLTHYLDLLQNNGIDDPDTLACFAHNELKDMGIGKHGDCLKLVLGAREGVNSVPLSKPEDVKVLFEKEESLLEYYDAVVEHRLDSIALLAMITEMEMDTELKITKAGHRKKLLLRLRERQAAQAEAERKREAEEKRRKLASPSNSPTAGAAPGQFASSGSSQTHQASSSPASSSASATNTPSSVGKPRTAHSRLNLSTLSEDDLPRIYSAASTPANPTSTPHATPASATTKWGGFSSFMDQTPPDTLAATLPPPHGDTSESLFDFGASSASHVTSRKVSPRHYSTTKTSSTAPRAANPALRPSFGAKSREPPKTTRRSSLLSGGVGDWGKEPSEPAATTNKILKVFENGKTKDDRGCMLSKIVPIPAAGANMRWDTLLNIVTRALGWHNTKCSIYRQGDDTAGGTEVANLWAFNGKPLTTWEDLEDGQWVVAGTANMAFIPLFDNESSGAPKKSSTISSTSSGGSASGKGAASLTTWADRLSNPSNFTGSARDRHGALEQKKERAGYSKKTPIKSRIMEMKKAALKGDTAPKPAEGHSPTPRSARYPRNSTSPGGSVSPPPPTNVKRTGPGASTTGSRHYASSTGSLKNELSREQQPGAAAEKSNGAKDSASARAGTPAASTQQAESKTVSEESSPLRDSTINSLEDLGSLMPKDLESANRGRLLGWQRGQLLGRGSFGMVYQGTLKDGTEAAVKLVNIGRPGGEAAPDELLQLFYEIRSIEQLAHPNIVKYYGCLFEDATGEIQIFLQLMTGGSLQSLITKHKGRVPLDLVHKYTQQLLSGLTYLHEKGIVHRDVKGANILIHENGDSALADFGTSKNIDEVLSRTHGCTTMVGTPYWMAPEVITACDDGAYDTKVDVWSVGCTVVEMLTGQPPWSGLHENMWAAIFHIAQSTEPPPLPSDLPQEITSFLKKTFERIPAKRPSCEELLKEPWMTDGCSAAQR
eukprot:Rhum_TRINITY_DN14529_c15_g2::Rhum_TRINITY_DN14529_c15_g2_i1::g.97005::m.97005